MQEKQIVIVWAQLNFVVQLKYKLVRIVLKEKYQFFHLKLYHLSYGTLECHVETGHLGHDWLNSIWKGECCYGYMDVDVINELYRWGRMDAFFIISLRANDSLDEDGVILMIKMP